MQPMTGQWLGESSPVTADEHDDDADHDEDEEKAIVAIHEPATQEPLHLPPFLVARALGAAPREREEWEVVCPEEMVTLLVAQDAGIEVDQPVELMNASLHA